MKTKNEIRSTNAQYLINTHENGNTARFARKIGTDAAYLYQIFSSKTKKNYGDKLARRTEEAYALSEGWMDNIHSHHHVIKQDQIGYGAAYPHDSVAETLGKYGIGYQPVILWEDPEDLPEGEFVLVPKLDVIAATGEGYENDDWPTEEKQLAFRTDFISKSLAQSTHLVVFTAQGESMMPTIWDGDTVLVDLAQNTVANGKIYAFVHHKELRIKRLYQRQDRLILHSDNDKDATYRYDEEIPVSEMDAVKIIGRIVNKSGSGGL